MINIITVIHTIGLLIVMCGVLYLTGITLTILLDRW
jgi:hypothetical protein